jgi:hypothetical protein
MLGYNEGENAGGERAGECWQSLSERGKIAGYLTSAIVSAGLPAQLPPEL